MSLLYVSCVLVVNATTGDRMEEYCKEKAVTLKECEQENIDYGPVKALNGRAVVLYCKKDQQVEA